MHVVCSNHVMRSKPCFTFSYSCKISLMLVMIGNSVQVDMVKQVVFHTLKCLCWSTYGPWPKKWSIDLIRLCWCRCSWDNTNMKVDMFCYRFNTLCLVMNDVLCELQSESRFIASFYAYDSYAGEQRVIPTVWILSRITQVRSDCMAWYNWTWTNQAPSQHVENTQCAKHLIWSRKCSIYVQGMSCGEDWWQHTPWNWT